MRIIKLSTELESSDRTEQMDEAYRLGKRDALDGMADIDTFTAKWGEMMGECYAEGVADIAMVQQTVKDDNEPDVFVNKQASGLRILKISFDCGGYTKVKKDKTHSGKMDTQTFPECHGKETDRDIVRKNRERRKSRKKASET